MLSGPLREVGGLAVYFIQVKSAMYALNSMSLGISNWKLLNFQFSKKSVQKIKILLKMSYNL